MKRILRQLADIRSGYQFRGSVEPHPEGDVSVIQIKDLRGIADIQLDALVKVKIEKSPESYFVQQGDILFLSRGHRLFATVITSPLSRTIAPGYFFIIRVHDTNVLPDYLAWYINQPPVQNYLKASQAGTHMPIVSKAAFELIELEVPPLHIQRAIVTLAQLSQKERQLSTELDAVRRHLIDTTCLNAVNAHSKEFYYEQ